ncbi:hypothetical protein [Maricaulis maris]|uniref:hypothetical protein n=1 Tax=Maricaulis maris TaxID=74318 RepID=UPI003BACE708
MADIPAFGARQGRRWPCEACRAWRPWRFVITVGIGVGAGMANGLPPGNLFDLAAMSRAVRLSLPGE